MTLNGEWIVWRNNMKAPVKYQLVDIKVITVNRGDHLAETVIISINDGWEREGGVVITRNDGEMWYSQVMVKYE